MLNFYNYPTNKKIFLKIYDKPSNKINDFELKYIFFQLVIKTENSLLNGVHI